VAGIKSRYLIRPMSLLIVHSDRLAVLKNAPVDVPKSEGSISPAFEI
jgi:hypothetical protein